MIKLNSNSLAVDEIKDVKIEKGTLSANIDGNNIEINLEGVSNLLEAATEEEQNTFEISPSGYGIHWPLIDEDISIDGLLGVVDQCLERQAFRAPPVPVVDEARITRHEVVLEMGHLTVVAADAAAAHATALRAAALLGLPAF